MFLEQIKQQGVWDSNPAFDTAAAANSEMYRYVCYGI